MHTAGIDSPRKQKYDDRLDAERLARKLAVHHLHPLPEAWFPPPPIRELARPRCWLAVMRPHYRQSKRRAQAKNRLQRLLEMHGLRPPGSDPFGSRGRDFHGFHRAWKSRQNQRRAISTFPQRRLSLKVWPRGSLGAGQRVCVGKRQHQTATKKAGRAKKGLDRHHFFRDALPLTRWKAHTPPAGSPCHIAYDPCFT